MHLPSLPKQWCFLLTFTSDYLASLSREVHTLLGQGACIRMCQSKAYTRLRPQLSSICSARPACVLLLVVLSWQRTVLLRLNTLCPLLLRIGHHFLQEGHRQVLSNACNSLQQSARVFFGGNETSQQLLCHLTSFSAASGSSGVLGIVRIEYGTHLLASWPHE